MKAILCEKYGSPDVLQLKEIDKPSPKDNEILIKIHNTTVTSGDCRVRGLNTPKGFKLLMRLALGFNRPRQAILGSELSGTIEAIGAAVSQFKVGDAVVAFTDVKMGCYAEYTCIAEDAAVIHKPTNLSFIEATALSFGGTTALHFLKKTKLQSGEKVLINGASGGVGTAMVQLAKQLGAEVTGVCSTTNVDLLKSIGADVVIDYTQQDFTQQHKTYDVIIDTTGKRAYADCKAALKDRGRLALASASVPQMLKALWGAMTSKHKVIIGPAFGSAEALQFLADLAQQGKYCPVIDRVFAFEQMADAHHYVEVGHKKGNVVISLE